MPRKRSAIGVRTPAARRMAARAARGQSSRTLENSQQSQARLQSDRLRHRVTCQRLRSKARSIIELALFCHHSTLIAANYTAFLQVFFIGDSSAEVATRHRNFAITKPHIVSILQDMLHRHNPYVYLFNASIEKMPSPDYKLVIKADKAPPGHHPRTLNAPTINEVAIVIVQENCDRRDIVLSKRGSGVHHFHIPQLIDGVPSAHKTGSCMDFHASLLMIRSRNPGITNWLLTFGDLTHQILVDIIAKVESERLHYISAHQAQLRATEYINLLDAIRTDRSHALIGRQVILPLWAIQEKIRPNQIDSIICAEIPNEEVDTSLLRTVTKNMIYGPCGHGYPNPSCMERGRCQKKYPRLWYDRSRAKSKMEIEEFLLFYMVDEVDLGTTDEGLR
ncbi:hypothetical protein LAZ67_5003096 [Cordylochernes scorpioides]|uniref:Helitron helicase-like domain-containing protein n=1 Tax=Cordylochernes scorpioides TaxID=51811 RepID=A0ABY6KJY9_9ARAC|nr:hypothetical protein LAZ67_5003096 [Cordylochernes scorpioides]